MRTFSTWAGHPDPCPASEPGDAHPHNLGTRDPPREKKIARFRKNKMLCASLGPQALALRSLNQQPLSSYLLSKIRYPGANYENFADLQLRLFIGGKPEQESASLMSRPMEITTRNPTNPTRIGLCTSFALHRSSHKRSATEGHSKSSQ